MLPDSNDPAPIVRSFAVFTSLDEGVLAYWLTRRLGHRNAIEPARVLIRVAPQLWAMRHGDAGEKAEATRDDAVRPSDDELFFCEVEQ